MSIRMFMDDFREPVKLCENCMNILFFFFTGKSPWCLSDSQKVPKRGVQNELRIIILEEAQVLILAARRGALIWIKDQSETPKIHNRMQAAEGVGLLVQDRRKL